MDMHKKVDLLMNVMYNLVLAVLFTVLAQLINAGGLMLEGILVDIIIGFILEMIIALFLPFTKWGVAAAKASKVKPGSLGFRAIIAGVVATCFATLMSAAMSAYSVLLLQKLPVAIWVKAWMRILPVFIVVAFLCALFILPYFVKLAKMILGVPEGEGHH